MKIVKMAVGNLKEAYIETLFSDGVNILISDDNNKGKTIVVQSIMYALGNRPIFPSTFEYKKYCYYVEFKQEDKIYEVVRVGDSFAVSDGEGVKLLDNLSEFKLYWDRHIQKLPQIEVRGEKRMVDMELYLQLFFVPQDSKDTSTIFNPGYYNKANFIDMVRFYAGEDEQKLSSKDVKLIKHRIAELEGKRRDRLALSKFYKHASPAKEYISRMQDKECFKEHMEAMSLISDEIFKARKKRKRLMTQRLLWDGTLKELRSLNQNIQVGELRCMDCNSSHIAYKGTGKITYSFDVSTPNMRKQIIQSIEDRIASYDDEIEKCNNEIYNLQNQLKQEMQDDDVTVESVLIYKRNLGEIYDVEKDLERIETQIQQLKMNIEKGSKQSARSEKAKNDLYSSIVKRMNKIKKEIDPESSKDYEDIFTKKGSVISGSESTVYYVARTIALAQLLSHGCPIIIDSFRAEDLSTSKEEVVLDLLKRLPNQCILTTTLKLEEQGKYANYQDINVIDYTGHEPNKLLHSEYKEQFAKIISRFGIQISSD